MKVYKEGQYLIFELDVNRTVKYDFANNTTIGLNGKVVKGLQKQLKDITINEILDACEDKNYAEFLKFIKRIYASRHIVNPGTILSKISEYSDFEQIFSSGVKMEQVSCNLKYKINEIPKSLLKVIKEKNIKLSNDLIKYWKEDIDSHVLGMSLEYNSLNEIDISYIYLTNKYIGSHWKDGEYKSLFNILIKEYNYNAKSLLQYIDYLITYEALNNVTSILGEIYDYVIMMSQISDKFEKYPKNFLTTHKIACRNYKRLKKEFNEEYFKKRINKDYECEFGDYVFIYPESTQDIKDEAVQQNNCVASYIGNVIDGFCHILFLRKKNDKNKSLITVEVNPFTNKIVQAKGKFNRETTDEENNVIERWNRRFSNRKEIAA